MVSLILFQIRVYQWIKNLLIFAPLLFSGNLFNRTAIFNSFLIFLAFSFTASGIYVINDLKDRQIDRLHPVKKERPIASGRLSERSAIIITIFCFILSVLFLIILNNIMLVLILICYSIMNIMYSIYFKNISIIDCFIIALGFELRISAGCEAIDVLPSDFILVVTFFLALTLGFIKRKGELKILNTNAVLHRKVLADYSVELLDKFIYSCATMTLISYMLYTIDDDIIRLAGNDNLKYSLIFVVYGLFRFVQLADMDKYQGEGDPTKLIYKDKPIQITIFSYLVFISYCFYGSW